MIILEEYNQRIKEIWEKNGENNQYMPTFLQPQPKKSILFLGMNPSLSTRGVPSVISNDPNFLIRPTEFISYCDWKNRTGFDIQISNQYDTLAGIHDKKFFPIFRSLLCDIQALMPAGMQQLTKSHLDLFLVRGTEQVKVAPTIFKDKTYTLTDFGKKQFDLIIEFIEKEIDPIFIFVANAEASKVFKKQLTRSKNISVNRKTGIYDMDMNGERIPILFTTMITGNRIINEDTRRIYATMVVNALLDR